MKLACLLFLGNGVISRHGGGNPFRPAARGPLPFLVPVKPVDPAPVCPALDVGAVAGQELPAAGWAARIEFGVLRVLGALLALTVVVCFLGAQHIAHTREKHALGRQLRQKEIELRAITQAYRSLESEKELLAALMCPRATAEVARADAVRAAAVGQRSRSGGAPQGKAVPARASSDIPSSRRSQVANARPVVRRGEIRG